MSLWWRIWRREVERAAEPPLVIDVFDSDGWLVMPARDAPRPGMVTIIPSRAGWYYRKLKTKDGWPDGIVGHYTATGAGTAIPMAERRRDHERSEFKDDKGHMPGSWHFTVSLQGMVIQQLSIRQGAFHAGSETARKTPVGWANHTCVGIELEGHGDRFTEPQIESACWLWRGIVQRSGIVERAHAMIQHSWIDPTRRRDPGEVFMARYAPRILAAAFEEPPELGLAA